ncbi:hypothetical protein [Streptomyces shenzhenensis]|uniref:hypothetical protein n=1 Tax=Streptomyces shenzhenensis TaxID=943815 RepID=UPI0036B21C18
MTMPLTCRARRARLLLRWRQAPAWRRCGAAYVSRLWLSSAAAEFFATHLTGAGEVDRYLAPGVTLSPVSPAPYTAVSVEQVSAAEEAAAAEKMPVDGTAVRVLARVEARDVGGRWPLAYELTLKARSGRWEVAAPESGTAPDGGAR